MEPRNPSILKTAVHGVHVRYADLVQWATEYVAAISAPDLGTAPKNNLPEHLARTGENIAMLYGIILINQLISRLRIKKVH
jgi:hypothetical protein